MLSFILAVALATPCYAPPKAPVHHKHHKSRVVLPLQSCAPPAWTPVMWRDDGLSEIPTPQVLTQYVPATTDPAPTPAPTYYAPPYDPEPAWFPEFGGGGVSVSVQAAPTVTRPVYVTNTTVMVNKPVTVTNTVVDNVTVVDTTVIDTTITNNYGHAPPHREPPTVHKAPEMDAGTGFTACLLLGGALAVMRGRRS